MRHWPFGLARFAERSLARMPLTVRAEPVEAWCAYRHSASTVRAEPVEALLAYPHPFGLTLRRGSGQGSPAAGRSLVPFVPACACESCSLREAAPGFRPGSRPPFLCRQERRQRSDPCRLGPRCARAALRCSVFAARAQLASFTTFTALKQTARSQLTKRAAHAAAKPCAAQLVRRGRRTPDSPRCASARWRVALLAPNAKRGGIGKVCEANDRIALGPRGRRRGAQGFGAARASALRQLTSRRLFERSERSERSEFGAGPEHRAPQSSPALAGPPPSGRLFFGDFLLAKQKFAQRGFAHFAQRSYANTKVTALSGAHPDAASRSEQPPRKSNTRLRYLSPNGCGYANKASTGSGRTGGMEVREPSFDKLSPNGMSTTTRKSA